MNNFNAPDFTLGPYWGSLFENGEEGLSGQFCINGRRLFRPQKDNDEMTLLITMEYANSIYMAADKRNTIVDMNNNIVKIEDTYTKIVASKSNRFLISSGGSNEFGINRQTFSDVVEEIDNSEWMQSHLDSSMEEISQYICSVFYKKIVEHYKFLTNGMEKFLKNVFTTTLYIAGFENGMPWLYCKVFLPWERESKQPVYFNGILSRQIFLTDGDVKDDIKKKMQGQIYVSEYDVIESLREYVQEGALLSGRVSEICDIYKISLFDGKERIKKLV